MSNPLQYLYALQRFGIKAGLRNSIRIARALGNPERLYPVIHIAGTNGKGSTAAMIASILTGAGYRTGLYTSPHLVRFNERIRVDGREIGDSALAKYTRMLRPHIDRTRGTFFEATTAIAFQHFADQAVDAAVIETGLGGRWDATNIVRPVLSVITSIGYDHTEILGTTLRRIAAEKGGIIKANVPCLTGVEDGDVVRVLSRIAGKQRSPLMRASEISAMEVCSSSLEEVRVNLTTPSRRYRDIAVSLGGAHQGRNLRLAVLAVEALAERFPRIRESDIRKGLRSVRRNTGIRGRLELLATSPLIIGDVGHNPDALRTIGDQLRADMGRKVITLFGVMKDKDVSSMALEIGRFSRLVVAVEPDTPRALDSALLTKEFHRRGTASLDGKSVARGLRTALQEKREGEPLLVIGSHYVVGEAIPVLKNTLRTLGFQ